MADKKISELTALTGANVADTDLLPIVDTKKITFGEFKTALDTATGFVRITGDTMTGNLSFGDNVKANFGDSDLQIYHNGTDSFIDEANASGWLYIRGNDIVIGKYTGETYFKGIADGAVELYHDNALKLATTATGIDVTGTTGMRSDGGGYLVKFLNSSSTSELSGFIYDNNQDNIEFTAYDSSYALAFKTNNTERMRIDSSGNVGIGVVPETGWRTAGGEKVLQLDTASIYNNSGNDLYINSNWYLNSSAQSTYIESDFATSYSQQSGKHIWYNAASGTAGNAVTFTQAMTLDASGNLLVGTTQTFPAFNNVVGCEVGGFGQISASRDGAEAMQLNRKTSDGDIALFKKDGTTVGSIGVNNSNVTIGNGGAGIKFTGSINLLEPWTPSSNSASDGAIDIGYSGGRFKDLYLSGGVVFNVAGGTGTSTSGTLDDYEEGTWTPVFTSSSNPPSLTYTQQNGYYVKVGHKVTIWGKIAINTISSAGTGNLRVGGLPFTVNDTVAETGGSIGLWYNMSSSTGYETLQQVSSQPQLFVMQNTTNSTHSVTAIANGGYFRFTTSYIV
jgi:hypothetical protein